MTHSRAIPVITEGEDDLATGTVEVSGLVGFLHSLIVQYDATAPAGTNVVVQEKNAPNRVFLDITTATDGEYPVRQAVTETDGALIDVDTTDNLISPTMFMLTGDVLEVIVDTSDALDPAVTVFIQTRDGRV